MKVESLNKYLKAILKIREYNNIVEALNLSNIMRKLSGISMFVLKVTHDNRITRNFSWFGFICYLLWYILFFYCAYKAYEEDQTILRVLYNTKVQRYGDDYEILSSTVFVVFALWKIPYSLNTNNRFMEIIIKVDRALKDLGEHVNYTRDAILALNMSVFQLVVSLFRILSIWLTFSRLDVLIPVERMYQVIYSDALGLIAAAHYCFYAEVVRRRFEHINKVLDDIKSHKSWEYKVFTRGSMVPNVQKAVDLQDKYICEKIKACAKIFGMLYKVTDVINKMFGVLTMATITLSQTHIIIYMFYFMEATAAGLFHDVEKYIAFFIYVSWQIGYGIVIIFLIVSISECAVYEAQMTSFILHEIMNTDFSPAVTAEAMQLSIQSLHQKPVFTANGLYELNYALLSQLTRSVYTYLIILLQFVTDSK